MPLLDVDYASKYPPGSKVRFTGVFLKNTGQIAGGEGGKIFTVRACQCSLCKTGRYLSVLDPEYPADTRHIAAVNLCGEHELTIRNDP